MLARDPVTVPKRLQCIELVAVVILNKNVWAFQGQIRGLSLPHYLASLDSILQRWKNFTSFSLLGGEKFRDISDSMVYNSNNYFRTMACNFLCSHCLALFQRIWLLVVTINTYTNKWKQNRKVKLNMSRVECWN